VPTYTAGAMRVRIEPDGQPLSSYRHPPIVSDRSVIPHSHGLLIQGMIAMLRGRRDRLRPGAQSTLDARVHRAVRIWARIALPFGRATLAARHTSLAFSDV
jgi:hypothetical protein